MASEKTRSQWSKAYFSTAPKSDILLNNMCESFNSFILDAREKPIKDVLAKIYVEAIRYSPMKSNEMHYQITRSDDRRDQHSVDLLTRSCSCRKYDLTGIPCKHAVCAIWCKKDDPEAYVHPYYLVETYRRCYATRIMPVDGSNLWPPCDLVPPLSPIYIQKVRRPANYEEENQMNHPILKIS
ncbi:uncharacterized protein LOC142541355 [Primulina tabacum]|uniref:uncharacterized protein LOC142541355 n=1 Tax=Primulina tabacum TaxID=48773 RepID=UPI003F5AB14A